jgi:uncharacterized Tic20 family protein
MSLFKKVLMVSVLACTFLFGAYVGIGDIDLSDVAEAASLKDTVKSKTTTTLTKTVDDAGKNFVKLARDIAVAGLVIVLVTMAYSMFIKKSVEGLADMKSRMGIVVLAVAFIFFTEQILGAIFGLLGYKL